MTPAEADLVLAELLRHTLEYERLVGARDRAVAAIMTADAAAIAKESEEVSRLEGLLEQYARATLTAGEKSIALAHGRIGLRQAATPALVPLSTKWTWKKVEAAVKRAYKGLYFHKPKPATIDKVAIKKLGAGELAKVGLKLDDTEHFYVELSRLERAA